MAFTWYVERQTLRFVIWQGHVGEVQPVWLKAALASHDVVQDWSQPLDRYLDCLASVPFGVLQNQDNSVSPTALIP
jgi:hypothetical protein